MAPGELSLAVKMILLACFDGLNEISLFLHVQCIRKVISKRFVCL